MTKMFASGSILCFVLFLATSSMAAKGATSSGGALVVIDDSPHLPDSGAELQLDPSPGIIMAWCTSANTFAIQAMHLSAQPAYRNEYGLYSGYSGHYQHPNGNPDDAFSIDFMSFDDSTEISDPFIGSWIPVGTGGI